MRPEGDWKQKLVVVVAAVAANKKVIVGDENYVELSSNTGRV